MDDTYLRLQRWLQAGKQVALATVVNKKGSALRQAGAKMLISGEGEMIGSISGGCVENAVVEEALACLRDRQPKLLHYGITDDTAWSVGLMCGGEIDVFVQPTAKANDVETLIKLSQARQAFVIVSVLTGARIGQSCVLEFTDGLLDGKLPEWLPEDLLPSISYAVKVEASQSLESTNNKYFVDVHKPSPRLVIIGAVHISMTLIKMARTIDYYTILIDPRKAFATRVRFPDVDEMLTDWPVEGMQKINLSNEDYVLLLSHDDKLDMPAAGAAIKVNAKYIGMLASRRTRERRSSLLVEDGYSEELVKKIHAPVGLSIGARSPEEIALSIIAEVTAVRYGKAE